jgi:STE24 endopeptidase
VRTEDSNAALEAPTVLSAEATARRQARILWAVLFVVPTIVLALAATLTPDPLHSAFYDSHPPAATRIARLTGS